MESDATTGLFEADGKTQPTAVGPLAARALPRARSSWYVAATKRYGLPVASVVVFLAIWQIVGSAISPILISTPARVIRAWAHMATDGELPGAFGTAMRDLLVGFALAIVIGVGIGIVMGRSPVVERIFNPYINFFQATPLIALVPLVVIWFGIGFTARLAVTFLLAVWSIIINTAVGVKSTPSLLLDVGQVYHLNRRQMIYQIALPNAVPHIFAGLRIGLGKALIGMLIAEMEVSVTGLGGLVVTYGNDFRTDYLMAGVFTASIVGVIAAALIEIVRRVAFPWAADVTHGRN